jgi:hypothetical protein
MQLPSPILLVHPLLPRSTLKAVAPVARCCVAAANKAAYAYALWKSNGRQRLALYAGTINRLQQMHALRINAYSNS